MVRNSDRSVKPRSEDTPHPSPSPNGEAHEPDDPGNTDFDPAAFEAPEAPDAPPSAARQPAEQIIDPFDPATYKTAQTLAAAAGVKEVLTDLQVRAPEKSWWVRRHPEPDYVLQTWVIDLKDKQEQYLVLPHLWPSLMGEPTFRPKTFYLAVNMQGKPFIWPVRRPADDTQEPDKWMRAPLEAARLAKNHWTRIFWSEERREHQVKTCEAADEPVWPCHPFRDLLAIAFKGYVIENAEHPVLLQLRGKKA
jgi:hypothetical protein